MKHLPRWTATAVSTLLLAIMSNGAPAHAAEPTSLTVTVSGAQATGHIYVALFDSADAYGGGEPLRRRVVPVEGAGEVSFSFQTLRPGTYALRMYQDVDGDLELDTLENGRPSEPIGFSNNAHGSFGPPTFAQAAFEIGEGDNAHAVRLH